MYNVFNLRLFTNFSFSEYVVLHLLDVCNGVFITGQIIERQRLFRLVLQLLLSFAFCQEGPFPCIKTERIRWDR